MNTSRGKADSAEMCCLRDLIAAACEPLLAVAQAQNTDIRIDLPETLEAPVERARIERVFFNLCTNSLEALVEGGSIRITGAQQNGSALIRVEDYGARYSAAGSREVIRAICDCRQEKRARSGTGFIAANRAGPWRRPVVRSRGARRGVLRPLAAEPELASRNFYNFVTTPGTRSGTINCEITCSKRTRFSFYSRLVSWWE